MKIINFQEHEILNRNQLKNILGGNDDGICPTWDPCYIIGPGSTCVDTCMRDPDGR